MCFYGHEAEIAKLLGLDLLVESVDRRSVPALITCQRARGYGKVVRGLKTDPRRCCFIIKGKSSDSGAT